MRATGEIGLLHIVSESASAAGVRRVEALTGAAALAYLDAQEARLKQAAAALKAQPEDVAERVAALLEERRKLTAEVSELRQKVALAGEGAAAPALRDVGGVPFLAQVLRGVSGKELRGLIDAHKGRIGSGAILLIAEADGKAAVAAGVTADLTARVSAVDLARAAAEAMGGKGGGGRPDMAQAGAADASRSEQAIAAAEAVLHG